MTNASWDFQVKCVKLNDLNIDARQRLGMVIVQPEYELISDGEVPFRISDTYRNAQVDLIEKAFEIRAAEIGQRGISIPFILFPEAAIPVHRPDGLDCLCQQLTKAQGDVIFIGGLEGQSTQEIEDLVNRFRPKIEIAKPYYDTVGEFVNVCVIAVKPSDGELSWHFQAKLAPSQWEQPRSMARGKRLLYFLATPPLAFVCQICFDHVAKQGREMLSESVCNNLIQESAPLAATLDFVFIPQYNPKPQEPVFVRNTSFILNHKNTHLSNQLATVVVINKASMLQEPAPSGYGRSGFFYGPDRWRIPSKDIGPRGYELFEFECESDRVTSAVFRKRTQAIHVATWIPPAHNTGDPGNPKLPLENPRSYLLEMVCDPNECFNLSADRCAGSLFVVCDCLPCKLRDTLLLNLPTTDEKHRWKASDGEQGNNLKAHYQEIRKNLLGLSCSRTGELLDLLLFAYDDKKANPDTWKEPRPGAVIELMASLCVLKEWRGSLNLATESNWTALIGDSIAAIIIDGEDGKRDWNFLSTAYVEEFEKVYFRSEMRKRPILFIALRSKGQVESGIKAISPKFTDLQDRGRLEDGKENEKRYTEHQHLQFFVCQGSLLEQAKLESSIKDFLESKMGAIHG